MTEKIFVAGHSGMVGSAIVRNLLNNGYPQEQVVTRTHAELNLTDQFSVRAFFTHVRPREVYLAAARVGDIQANDRYPAEFIYENVMIQASVIHEAFAAGVRPRAAQVRHRRCSRATGVGAHNGSRKGSRTNHRLLLASAGSGRQARQPVIAAGHCITDS